MSRYINLVFLVLVAFLVGCNKSEEVDRIIAPYEKIEFMDETKDIFLFTVSDEGDLFILEVGGVLTRYTHDGTLVKEYADTMYFTALCYGKKFYAYDSVKSRIVSMNLEDGSIQDLSGQLEIDRVIKLVEVDGYLYMLAIPTTTGKAGLGGLVDFGETLYRIDLKTGEVKDTGEDSMIAIYGASDGGLYYYANRDNIYSLFSYDTKNGKSKRLYDMNHVGYTSSFVYEKDYFICSVDKVVKCIRLSDYMEMEIEEDLFIFSGNNMNFLHGNVIYCGTRTEDEVKLINSIYLDDITFEEETNYGDTNTETPKEKKGRIKISTAWRPYINPSAVKNVSGIDTFIVDQSSYGEVFLTEIMAGNPDVDIYIISAGSEVAAALSEKGVYVPLNDSKVINSYMEQCFDYVADEMQSPSGDIWMLPITLDANVVWYVSENLENFEVDLDEFRYLDSFMKLGQRMPKTGSYAAYVDYPSNLGYFLHEQYDMTYNDYANKKIDFETPLYREFFDKLWTGWISYSELPRHPLFRSSKEDYNYEMEWESTLYDKTKVIFKTSSISDHVNMKNVSLEDWRALPLPHISSEVEGNIVTMLCAFINPYSQNKELALEYLEAITQVPFNFNGNYLGTFLFQDKTMYESYYDITSPAFEDIYNIIQNGVIGEPRYSLNGNIIDDYQNGRLSLDEAIAAIQREAEMWANE